MCLSGAAVLMDSWLMTLQGGRNRGAEVLQQLYFVNVNQRPKMFFYPVLFVSVVVGDILGMFDYFQTVAGLCRSADEEGQAQGCIRAFCLL